MDLQITCRHLGHLQIILFFILFFIQLFLLFFFHSLCKKADIGKYLLVFGFFERLDIDTNQVSIISITNGISVDHGTSRSRGRAGHACD